LCLSSCITKFAVNIDLKENRPKIRNPSTSRDTSQTACNLGFIFDKHLYFPDQISALSKSCYRHIRALRCIRPYLDLHAAKTIATSIVHPSFTIPKYQINMSPTHPECCLLSRLLNPSIALLFSSLRIVLKFLNEMNIRLSISLNKILNTIEPSYLYDIISIQPPQSQTTSLDITQNSSSVFVTPFQQPSFEHTAST